MKSTLHAGSVEVRTSPLTPPGHIYTLYQLFVNGICVREQISAFSQDDIAAHNRAAAQYASHPSRRAA